MSMRRTAGRVGWGGGPPGEPASLFSPRPEPQVLEERERDHGHQRVPVQAGPGAALEVVEAELLLHLLVRLLAHPARLDRGRQLLERGLRWQVGEVVLALAARAVLADQPGLVPGQVPPVAELRTLSRADPQGGELGRERPFGAQPPAD